MNSATSLSHMFVTVHSTDAARILERFQAPEIVVFLSEAPAEVAALVLQHMDLQIATQSLDELEAPKTAAIIERVPIHIAAVLLRRMGNPGAALEMLSADRAEDLRLLLRYPDNTAGSLMDPRIFTIPDDLTVEETLNRVQAQATEVKDYIYVVDRQQILVGVFSLNHLMEAQPYQQIAALMRQPAEQISPFMTHQAIIDHPGWRLFHDLPVVDPQGVFLGALTYRTMRKIEASQSRGASSNDVTSALGELYWIGLSAFVKGAAAVIHTREE